MYISNYIHSLESVNANQLKIIVEPQGHRPRCLHLGVALPSETAKKIASSLTTTVGDCRC